MDTQLHCQSRQTNTKLILVWKGATAGGPGLLERSIPCWDGNISGAPEPWGAQGSWAPSPLATGEREISLFRAFLPRLCHFPGSSELWVAQQGWAALAQPWWAPSRGCHPFPPPAIPFHPLPSLPRRGTHPRPGITESTPNHFYPLPKNHRIKSVPLKRTEKCRFLQFGRSSYTCLILPVFPRFPRGGLLLLRIMQNLSPRALMFPN